MPRVTAPHRLETGELALRYRAGRFFELFCFLGEALVFDHGQPAILDELPLFEQRIHAGDLVVQTATGFEVRA